MAILLMSRDLLSVRWHGPHAGAQGEAVPLDGHTEEVPAIASSPEACALVEYWSPINEAKEQRVWSGISGRFL